MHQFDLEVDKSSEPHLIRIRIEENEITFTFEGINGGSAPLSRAKETDFTIGVNKKPFSNTPRQRSFHALVCVLASLHPAGIAPAVFYDRNGNCYKLDKATAERAAESLDFDRVCDADGRHGLRPRLARNNAS